MNTKIFLVYLSMLLVISILALSPAAEPQEKQGSQVLSIEGTYKFISRKLPDGTMQVPPDVMGLITYTKNHRNFNIMWKDDKGKILSISYVATYKLTATEYSETSMYHMVNDQISGQAISYDFSGQTGTSPVTIEDGRIRFKLPLYDEPSVVFEGKRLTAEGPGFVDFWEKVQ